MRKWLSFVLLFIALGSAIASAPLRDSGQKPAAGASSEAPRPAAITWEPYTLESFDGGQHAAELGRLWVRENREKNRGRRIQLAVVRLRSAAPEPGPPILFLAGGPGIPGTGLGRVPVYLRLFDRLRNAGDVLLLDMRGTGLSRPNLEWREERPVPPDVFASDAKALREITRRARACADHWRARGVDMGAYNSLAIADDVEELRQALGRDRISLFGWSYGTEAALATLRRHGGHIHRAVLAGTRGPDHVLHLPAANEFLLMKIARLAAADPRLDPPMPDLMGALREQLDHLDRQPVAVTVRPSGRKASFAVGKIGLQTAVARLIGDGRALPLLPALVASLSRGDTSLLARQIERLTSGFTRISAMNLAVNAASGWSREREMRVRREAAGTLLGDNSSFSQREIRRLLSLPDVGPALRAPLWSPVPTLFLSGSLDGTTPPYQAEEVRWGFPAGVHLIVENGGHETLPAAEVQEVVAAFFRGEDVAARRIVLPPPRFLPLAEALSERRGNGP
jgi:pimeloyl-ACP methyl ester carboxylesterase